MSVVRTLRYSCPPSESITLEGLKTFLHEAALLEFEEGLAPRVTLPNSGSTSKVGMIRSIVIEDVLD